MACHYAQLMAVIAMVLLVHASLLFVFVHYEDADIVPSTGPALIIDRSGQNSIPEPHTNVNSTNQIPSTGQLRTEPNQSSPPSGGEVPAPCKDSLCTDYLTQVDQEIFCGLNKKYVQMAEPPCRFVNGTGRKVVALASFPGSGNTWVRSMLQKATGICTGSVYCDGFLKSSDFPGESIVSPSVIAVKTHESPPSEIFDTAIIIMRNPFHALIAERARRVGGHIMEAAQQHYGKSAVWENFVFHYIDYWTGIILEWVIAWRPAMPIFMVMYEDLVNDTAGELARMLHFLGHPVDPGRVESALLSNHFKRKHTVAFQHFTAKQIDFLNGVIEKMEQALSDAGLTHVLSVKHYLQSSDQVL